MKITSMTTADFGNKHVVLNQSNSMMSGVIMVLQRMYLGRKENAKVLLLKNESEKQRRRCITNSTYNSITLTH